ncbi:DUF4209 domain-containing protein [Thermosipho ferrireducens]|uniref:DUF4209 domain-containing protein n=1 Tax=Thermosipho ferrireducens TaxID=2571116 RepID=A0ABX7S974_9BACT|nr:DUF4209 domain-containing protein [Thermosipho ferrireducens]QTA38513.1 DUF4209 domain-containing protein [Thermosipho ferrireducens]
MELFYYLKNEAKKVLIKIKELNQEILSELSEIEISIKISSEKFKKAIDKVVEGELEAALEKIAMYFIPRKDETLELLKDILKKYPLSFLIPREIIDHKGRIIATVDPIREDIDGHSIFQIPQNMQINSFLLHETVITLKNKFNLNTETVVEYLYNSPIFEDERKEFFIRGIGTYLNNDYLVAIHILVPQIEALVRNLAQIIGVPILTQNRFNGFNYKTLYGLLSDEKIIAVLSEDMCLYLKALFTDVRGWNIRNDVCHGISDLQSFNQVVADRVFHVLICLALLRE